MTRVLLIGLRPDAVDFSDPALPPGLNADKIQAGIDAGLREMTARGWQAEHCLIRADAEGVDIVARRVSATSYDCAVIGGGIRMPPKMLWLFEAIVNALRTAAPGTAIAFNTQPEDSADAAARWLKV